MGGRSSKRKGSTYEREFVRLVQDAGLPAHRVPLSGAMGGEYTDDVVVADEWRIECKYRADGSGFKRLYNWLGDGTNLVVMSDDEHPAAQLIVKRIDHWCWNRKMVVDGHGPPCESFLSKRSKSSWATLRGWIGDADYLAVRMPRMPWLVIEVVADGR